MISNQFLLLKKQTLHNTEIFAMNIGSNILQIENNAGQEYNDLFSEH